MEKQAWLYKYPRCSMSWVFALGVILGIVSGGAAIGLLARWFKVLIFAGCLLVGVAYLYGRVRSTWPWYWFAAGHFWTSFMIMTSTWSVPTAGAEMAWEAKARLFLLLGIVFWAAEAVACIALGGLFILLRRPVVWHDGSLCPTCGYSLVGNMSGRCPECGTVFDPEFEALTRANREPTSEGLGQPDAGD